MKFGIVLLAGALSLGIAGCAPRNGAFGDVGATRPSDPDVVGFGELFDSALLIGPAFQNGGSSALTEQLIWEAAHDTDMAPSLWRRQGFNSSQVEETERSPHGRDDGWDAQQMAQSPEQAPLATDSTLLP